MDTGTNQGDTVNTVIMVLAYGVPFILLFFGGFVGTILERRHLKSIREREAATGNLPAVPTRTLDSGRTVVESRLVNASVVVSHDYLKRFLASIRKIFGGRLRSYESLIDRARREAILRVKEQVPGTFSKVNFYSLN